MIAHSNQLRENRSARELCCCRSFRPCLSTRARKFPTPACVAQSTAAKFLSALASIYIAYCATSVMIVEISHHSLMLWLVKSFSSTVQKRRGGAVAGTCAKNNKELAQIQARVALVEEARASSQKRLSIQIIGAFTTIPSLCHSKLLLWVLKSLKSMMKLQLV